MNLPENGFVTLVGVLFGTLWSAVALGLRVGERLEDRRDMILGFKSVRPLSPKEMKVVYHSDFLSTLVGAAAIYLVLMSITVVTTFAAPIGAGTLRYVAYCVDVILALFGIALFLPALRDNMTIRRLIAEKESTAGKGGPASTAP